MDDIEKTLKQHLVRTIETEFQIEIILDMLLSYISGGDTEKKEYMKLDYQKRLKEHIKNAPQSYFDLLKELM